MAFAVTNLKTLFLTVKLSPWHYDSKKTDTKFLVIFSIKLERFWWSLVYRFLNEFAAKSCKRFYLTYGKHLYQFTANLFLKPCTKFYQYRLSFVGDNTKKSCWPFFLETVVYHKRYLILNSLSYGYHIYTDKKDDTKDEKWVTFLKQYRVPGLSKVNNNSLTQGRWWWLWVDL